MLKPLSTKDSNAFGGKLVFMRFNAICFMPNSSAVPAGKTGTQPHPQVNVAITWIETKKIGTPPGKELPGSQP